MLEEQIALHMPLSKKLPLAEITLSEPRLNLREEHNEVSLFLNVDVVVFKGFKGGGRGELTGSIDYQPEQGAFYLVNPRIVNLSIDRTPTFVIPVISQAATLLLTKSLASYPIYRLDENDPKHKMAKASLKKVSVTDNTVMLTLGLP